MHAADVPMRLLGLAVIVIVAVVVGRRYRLFMQRLQYAAFRDGRGRGATLADRLDLALELSQLGNARLNVAQVLAQ